MAFYIDTSALAKLVVEEAESAALGDWIRTEHPILAGADLLRTELIRTVRRAEPERVETAQSVLDRVVLLNVSAGVFDAAARIEPPLLRSLDAIHLAAALELGDDLEALVTYDSRLADAAAVAGITVIAPA